MKLLIVSQYYWPEAFRINEIAKSLVDRGHQVTVLTGVPNYPKGRFFPGYHLFRPAREHYQGVTIIRVPLLPRGRRSKWLLSINYASFLLSSLILGPLRLRHDYDLVFAYAPSPITVALPAILLSHCSRSPILLWVQDLWPESLTASGAVTAKPIITAVGKLVGWIYRHCSLLLVQSRCFIDEVQKYDIALEKIHYLPNPAEELYRPLQLEPDADERNELPNGFCVMFAGNIGLSQSLDTVLAAAQLTQSQTDIHWVIIGDGLDRERVSHEVIRRGLTSNVHLLGWKPVEAMPRYFSLADILLVTLRLAPIFTLTVPAKVQSYLACGKPIVSCLDGEGSRIIEESHSGVGVPAEAPEALAEAVLDLYSKTPEHRAALGRNGMSYFEHNFSMKLVLDRLETIINSAVEEQK
ncbi:MAG: glycosyltransferase WbuB [Acidobacteria bacterium]|nr:glycosyltransferase WbuB [Acidobacteriota bacterium]